MFFSSALATRTFRFSSPNSLHHSSFMSLVSNLYVDSNFVSTSGISGRNEQPAKNSAAAKVKILYIFDLLRSAWFFVPDFVV